MGYHRNKYYWFVMNNLFKGKKFTIIWHDDDLKMSHVDFDTVSSILADIDAEYRKLQK